MIEKKKFFFTEKYQIINSEGMIELQKAPFGDSLNTTANVSHKDQQLLKPSGGRWMGNFLINESG